MILKKIISAVISFIIAVLPFSTDTSEKKCSPEFNGTFIQSWMSSTWDDARWQKEIKNMQDAGIKYLILQDVANKAYKSSGGNWSVYYNSDLSVFDSATVYPDVIESALRNCKSSGIKVFIGLAMFDDFWTEGALTSQYSEMCSIAADMVEEIYHKYYFEYPDCFYGWYFTPEFNNVLTCQFNIGEMSRGVNEIIDSINSTNESLPLLMSPFYAQYLSSGPVLTLINLVRLLNGINFRDGDILAPQDAVGAGWVNYNNLERNWKLYSAAVNTIDADVRLWANCENFDLAIADSITGGVFTRPETENSRSVPTTLDRFIGQMDIASEYCENIITFSYNHYFSPDCVDSVYMNTYLDYIENSYTLEKICPSEVTEFTKKHTDNSVILSWNESSDNFGIAYYRIEKNGKFLARIEMCYGDEPLEYVDVTGNSDDVYSITAFDAAGNSSETVTI
ncbi:MAG: DUF4434 domain-containing protein [Clostridia bacterium]|nr:DUF4434 domain-containing protein [Clostridia bacterium]